MNCAKTSNISWRSSRDNWKKSQSVQTPFAICRQLKCCCGRCTMGHVEMSKTDTTKVPKFPHWFDDHVLHTEPSFTYLHWEWVDVQCKIQRTNDCVQACGLALHDNVKWLFLPYMMSLLNCLQRNNAKTKANHYTHKPNQAYLEYASKGGTLNKNRFKFLITADVKEKSTKAMVIDSEAWIMFTRAEFAFELLIMWCLYPTRSNRLNSET